MKKIEPVVYEQPEFIGPIVDEVKKKIDALKLPEQLIVKLPDFTKPIGADGNFFRTVLTLEKVLEAAPEGEAPVLPSEEKLEKKPYVVSISNNFQTDSQSLIKVVSYESKTEKSPKSATRHYLPKELLDKREVKVAYRPTEELVNDIALFLTTGDIPSGNPNNK